MAATVRSLDFAAQVDAWVRKTQARMEAVFRESTQRVVSLAQSRIPVDTGFARASIQASLSEMPQINSSKQGEKGKTYGDSTPAIALVISNAKIGGAIYVGWTAAYVLALEYGHSKQAPSGFVRVSAQEWPRVVREVTQEAKGRINRG